MATKLTVPLLAFLLAAPLHAEPLASEQIETGAAVEVQSAEITIAQGDSLDRLLAQGGISPSDRAEAALALDGVYDIRDLRPGNVLRWTTRRDDNSRLESLQLLVGSGPIDYNFVR